MDSFEKHGLDASSFGEDSALSAFRSFDAFPKTKPTYTQATSRGGQWTLGVLTLALLLSFTELRAWWAGTESHHFSVERGVGHELQLNLDIVVAMPCQDLHVNVQDASMDRIMAGELLKKEDTTFDVWHTGQAFSSRQRKKKGGFDKNDRGEFYERNRPEDGSANDLRRRAAEEEDSHVTHVLGHMREARSSKKFAKTPRLKRGAVANACRIYGSLEGNKVQGDFHITARGHGYLESGMGHAHLDHGTFNFSHQINELSFGPHYPALLNPLDKTSDIANQGQNFMKFQYYVSIVPTIFTKRRVSTRSGALDPAAIPQPPTLDLMPDTHKLKHGEIPKHVETSNRDSQSIFTNQYAATSQSREVSAHTIPGVFFKYDIEPILLIVSEQRGSLAALLVRLVNVVSGIVVAGGWGFALTEWASELMKRRRDRSRSEGVLHGRMGSGDFKSEKFG